MGKNDFIRIIEYFSPNPKDRKKCSIFINGEGGDISDPKSLEEALKLPLSKLDKIALEKRTAVIKLSIGEYKVISDTTIINAGYRTRFTDYEKFDK